MFIIALENSMLHTVARDRHLARRKKRGISQSSLGARDVSEPFLLPTGQLFLPGSYFEGALGEAPTTCTSSKAMTPFPITVPSLGRTLEIEANTHKVTLTRESLTKTLSGGHCYPSTEEKRKTEKIQWCN